MTNPSAAENAAAKLIEQADIARPPVPVEKIAQMLGVQITYEAFTGNASGMLFRDAERTLIGVNSTHPANRQRFTIAHEIAHLRLHKGQIVFIDELVRINWRNGTSDLTETQANAFAAELLMPRKFLTQEIERVLAKSPRIEAEMLIGQLAETFRVSTEAMRYRLINLGVLGPYSSPIEA